MLDIAVQAVVQDVGIDQPPATPAVGEAWAVGVAPGGAWAGHAGALAGWTPGGWRFVPAREGTAAWCVAAGRMARHRDGAWRLDPRAAAIAAPAGGATVDGEARAAIGAILAALRAAGWVAPA